MAVEQMRQPSRPIAKARSRMPHVTAAVRLGCSVLGKPSAPARCTRPTCVESGTRSPLAIAQSRPPRAGRLGCPASTSRTGAVVWGARLLMRTCARCGLLPAVGGSRLCRRAHWQLRVRFLPRGRGPRHLLRARQRGYALPAQLPHLHARVGRRGSTVATNRRSIAVVWLGGFPGAAHLLPGFCRWARAYQRHSGSVRIPTPEARDADWLTRGGMCI